MTLRRSAPRSGSQVAQQHPAVASHDALDGLGIDPKERKRLRHPRAANARIPCDVSPRRPCIDHRLPRERLLKRIARRVAPDDGSRRSAEDGVAVPHEPQMNRGRGSRGVSCGEPNRTIALHATLGGVFLEGLARGFAQQIEGLLELGDAYPFTGSIV